MTESVPEIIDLVERLNSEINETKAGMPYLEQPFAALFTGELQVILYFSFPIWTSEEDERKPEQPLEDFIRQELLKLAGDLLRLSSKSYRLG